MPQRGTTTHENDPEAAHLVPCSILQENELE